METKDKLREIAIKASKLAHAPYSAAYIGCAVLTSDGQIYSGCNIENSSYGGTVCAERVAVMKAVSEGHKEFSAIYVYSKDGWPPCGFCRQVLTEFSSPSLLIFTGDENGNEKQYSLSELFPEAFTPDHLK